MTLAIYDKFITKTDSGETIPSATVSIYNADTAALAVLYTDIDGTTPAGNPVTASSSGRVQVYMQDGRYNITAVSNGSSVNYPNVQVGVDSSAERSSLTINEIETNIQTYLNSSRVYESVSDILTISADRAKLLNDTKSKITITEKQSDYFVLTGAESSSDGINIDNLNNFDMNSGYKLVRVKDGYDDSSFKRNRVEEEYPVSTSESFGALSLFMSSINKRKPIISPIINAKLDSIMGSEFKDVVPSSSGGILMGGYTSAYGEDMYPTFVFAAPVSAPSLDRSFSITIDPLSGSHDDLTVEYLYLNTAENGAGQEGSRVSMSRSGDVYSATNNSSDGVLGRLFGIVVSSSSSNDFDILAAVLTDESGKRYNLSKKMRQNIAINFAPATNRRSVYVQEYDNGVEIRSIGAKTGKVPSKVWASPSALADSGEYVGSVLGFETVSYWSDPMLGMTPIWTAYTAETYYINGFKPPAVMLKPGTYVNQHGTAHLKPRTTALYAESTEWFYGCSNGVALLSDGPNSSDGVVFGSQSGSVYPQIYIANIHCDNSVTRPFFSLRCNIYGLNLKCENSSAEGFDSDYGDLTLENSEFTGCVNDGINSHESGHTVLVNCSGHDNLDDGFSPHDDCTYEVYGGKYYNNGKGNIIPAHGAKGFITGVESYGSTGLSPRTPSDFGTNDGGFVCYADDRDDPTTMFVSDSSSTGDNNGIVSSGRHTFTLCHDVSVSGSVKVDLVSNAWQEDNGADHSGEAGMLIVSGVDTSSYSVTDEKGLVVSYNEKMMLRNK